jgi:hypothetical protein
VPGVEDPVGLLQKSLYGTRDAAANFQAEVKSCMASMGFSQARYNPQVYYHAGRDIRCLVHGDDFMAVGEPQAALWLKAQLERRFTVSTNIVGTGPGEVKEARLLNRIIRASPDGGWEYEADSRHAEIIVKQLGLDKSKGVSSPGESPGRWEDEENSVPLVGSEIRGYRALAARANYLAQDRTDIQFAAKEICRGMSSPSQGDYMRLKRLGRYLISYPRVVWSYAPQRMVKELTVYSDSDWAGCRRTARSTSGGAICRGSHCLRTYSVTQKSVALSSAEAELISLVRATTEGIGMCQLAEGVNIILQAAMYADSSAALAVVQRRGNGRLRHIRVGHLWIPELAECGDVKFRKVDGLSNPADLATKFLGGSIIQQLLPRLGQAQRDGRSAAQIALQALHRDGAEGE